MRSFVVLSFLLAIILPGAAHAAAQGDGLYATYYDQNGQQRQYFTGNTVTRVDPTVDFDWGAGAPAPGIGTDDFSVRWTGEIEMPNWGGGNRQWVDFRTRTDDGVRVYIDGTLVIDNWTDHGPTQDVGAIRLRRGQRYPIVIEFYERGGGAVMEFEWDPPGIGGGYQIVPQAYLYSLRPPEIVSVLTGSSTTGVCGDLQVLEVTFDQPVDNNEAEDENNYVIPGGPNVASAALSADGLTVTLTLDAPLVEGQVHSLEVGNIESPAGTIISPNPAVTSFTPLAGIQQPGLVGTYYDQNGVPGAFFTGTETERVDSVIDFDWGTGAPSGTTAGADNFSVIWEGFIDVPANVYVEFTVFADDGALLYVDGVLLVNTNNDTSSGAQWGFAPGRHSIELQYAEVTGQADVELRWTICPDFSCFFGGPLIDETVPAANLFHCTDPYVLDHFGISVGAGTASTCAAQDVGISARNSSNFVLSGYIGDIAITTSSNHGDWSGDAVNPPQGTLANGTADDGAAAYSFSPADGGAIELDFLNVHADDLSITVTDAASGVVSASGTIAFRDNAFVITATDALGDEVVAGRAHAIEAAMWRRDPGTGNCSVASGYAGTKNLKTWITRDGADPGGAAPGGETLANRLPNAQPGASNLALDFTNGVASFDLVTDDVGKYVVHLLDDTRTFATGVDIGGMSNTLTTRPFALAFRNIGAGANPEGWLPGDAAFTGAGNDVGMQLAGVLWAGADDANNDGVPDGYGNGDPADNADLSDNAVTAAFAADGSVGIHAAVPAAGSINDMDFTAGDFAGGIANLAPLRYSEVGSVMLQADATSYLGSAGIDVTGVSPPIGRFTPAYYDVVVNAQGCGTFTYSGQPLASVTVTAYNAQGAITQNFSGASGYARDVVFSDAGGNGLGSFAPGEDRFAAGDFVAGVAMGIDAIRYEFTNRTTAPLALSLRGTDTDGASSAGHVEGVTEIRSGRAVLLDQAASTLTVAQQPLLTEYFLGGDWTTNTVDVCTAATLAVGDFSLSGPLAGATSVSAVTFAAGEGFVTLAPPGATNGGTVDVTGDVSDWLHFDWNGSGPEDPQGTVSFREVYEVEDGFIDRREIVP